MAVTAVAWLLGCAQIAGTNDYQVATETTREPEPLPPPFLTGSDECEACAADKCGEALAACEESETCQRWLADLREHPDPLSAYQRYKIENDMLWESAHDGAPHDRSLLNVRSCAQECLAACRIGQDFSCVGNFDWDLPQPSTVRTRVALSSVGVTAQARACQMADQCGTPLASQNTDERGFAELAIQSEAIELGPIGYLEFKRGEGLLDWQYVQTRPLADTDYVSMDLIEDGVLHKWHDNFRQSFDDGQSLLIVVPADCAGVNAKQVRLEAWYYTRGQLTFCDNCFYAYSENATESPKATLQAYATTGRGGYIANVSPGIVYVVLRRVAEPHDMVSVAGLVLQGGEVAAIRLHPASKQELLTFPDPKN